MESTLQNYQKVYEMLEDEQSKFIYLNRLNYLISGNRKFIKKIIPQHLPYADEEGHSNFVEDVLPLIPDDAKIVLYGAGEYPNSCYAQWSGDSRIIGFCSNNKEKQKNGYLGYSVMSPEALVAQNEYYVLVDVIERAPQKEILAVLSQAGYPKEKIFCLFDLQVDKDQYFPEDIICFGEEVFIDAGTYHLETSLELMKRCSMLKKVYAFEADPKSYEFCLNEKDRVGFPGMEILPYATWSRKDQLCFKSKGSKTSSVVEDKTLCRIDAVAVDEVVDPKDKITFIKMDVEGAELESLKGAQRTIQRDKPKLAICIYHKPEDLVTIPLYVKRLVPEYKLYVRHHSNYNCETVLYAIP